MKVYIQSQPLEWIDYLSNYSHKENNKRLLGPIQSLMITRTYNKLALSLYMKVPSQVYQILIFTLSMTLTSYQVEEILKQYSLIAKKVRLLRRLKCLIKRKSQLSQLRSLFRAKMIFIVYSDQLMVMLVYGFQIIKMIHTKKDIPCKVTLMALLGLVSNP